MLRGEFEPSFGNSKQFGLFFFASSLLRGSQSLLSVAAILFILADHVIAAETFRKEQVFGKKMLKARSVASWDARVDWPQLASCSYYRNKGFHAARSSLHRSTA